jgi:hypothetical protein
MGAACCHDMKRMPQRQPYGLGPGVKRYRLLLIEQDNAGTPAPASMPAQNRQRSHTEEAPCTP